MQKENRFQQWLIVVIVLIMASCQKENQKQDLPTDELLSVTEKVIIPSGDFSISARQNPDDYNTFYGPQVQMGNGHVRSWININRHDVPLAIGIEFTANSFEGLPTDPLDHAASTFTLMLHQKAKAITPFDHITINWGPEGHEPPDIYDVPHFDMHFYKISVQQQLAITGAFTGAPTGYLPSTYVIEGATVPQMGTHWLDPSNSPELHGVPFTYTFIYGSHNGNVHFLEPMITRAFMISGSSANIAFPQPTLFSPTGYYPTWYRIWKNPENGRSYVALTGSTATNGFVWR